MRRIFILLLICSQYAFAQKEAAEFEKKELLSSALSIKEYKAELVVNDFSKLFTQTDNSAVFGFIGDNYQRIRVKIISVIKNKHSPDTYDVYGKSMVKSNIDQFHGILNISHIRKKMITSYGIDDQYKGKGIKGEFVIVGNYVFSEPKNEKHSGIFKGVFKSEFYLDDRNRVQYDEIDVGDSYANNQFVGQWKSYDGKYIKRCNWGDYRIPDCGDLDMGAGDFSPAEKYRKNGWQNLDSKVKWWL